MKQRATKRAGLDEAAIDRLVEAEAGVDSAWGPPLRVRPPASKPLALPRDLAARAAFLARLHHAGRVEEWLTRVVRERIELEEAALAQAKRSLSAAAKRKKSASTVSV